MLRHLWSVAWLRGEDLCYLCGQGVELFISPNNGITQWVYDSLDAYS